MVSLLVGFLLGIIYLIYKEKRSEKIYEIKDILKIKPFKFVEQINLKDINSNQDKILFLKEFLNRQSKEQINLILLGNKRNRNKKI